jgi:translation initiation factor 1 (eIF-1/SUI1)
MYLKNYNVFHDINIKPFTYKNTELICIENLSCEFDINKIKRFIKKKINCKGKINNDKIYIRSNNIDYIINFIYKLITNNKNLKNIYNIVTYNNKKINNKI